MLSCPPALLLAGVIVLAGCGTAARTPTSHPTLTAGRSSAPQAGPGSTAAAAVPACRAGDLNAVIGSGGAAMGGQTGADLFVGNQSSGACTLTGVPGIQMLDAQHRTIPTNPAVVSNLINPVVLAAGHVALDHRFPQPGEAELLIGWHTGDTQPGVCSRPTDPAATVLIELPQGGGTLTVAVQDGPWKVAPCGGAIQVFPFAAASPQKPSPTAREVTIAAAQVATGAAYSPGICQPIPAISCLTGGALTIGSHAAYASFDVGGTGGGAGCYTYAYQDGTGWHTRNVACTQQAGFTPARGQQATVHIPGGGCGTVRATPGRTSRVITCVADGALVDLDDGPTYIPETPHGGISAASTIWWHIHGQGWMVHDFLSAKQ